eukprot:CAMPEP_0201569412 /NCGR_PEP_ID=MMETSP0190_2-20130828/11068_1 /ASSEMBLY_ACC=CAM_ASM_000263 /TAXON_ID=37353 /ORGANISM="Rosalina sp." /LENGTH=686 /DNA_ID=CAMNT_0047991689 /DNA_START=126 /DNA_END=2186 /DNA_ORIENTATION=+
MKWAKDAGRAPTFNEEDDGSVTAIFPIMEGTYNDIEPVRRRLQQMSSAEFAIAVLDEHNRLRSTTAVGEAPCKCGSTCGTGHKGAGYHPGATNMNSLFWDKSLADVAQTYADKCLFIHNDQRTNEQSDRMNDAQWAQTKDKYCGENLYISSTGTVTWNNKFGDKDYGIEGGLYGWWIECEDYKFPEGGSCGGQVGHYTQYVRYDSRFVGCGITICPSGIRTESTTYTWAEMNMVCNYMGGQYGDAPYEAATSASKVASNCDPDRTPNAKWPGLCDGPQIADWFENPQSSYDKTAQTRANGWICDDGTGRGDNVGCNVGTGTTSKIPTPYPTTSTTTMRPTNNPVNPTPRPSQPPSTPYPTRGPVSDPTSKPTARPTAQVVTQRPTTSTTTTTARPTNRATKKPTGYPTTSQKPTASPVTETGSCDLSDCEYATNIQWISDTYKYNGLATYAWSREKELIDLQSRNGWSSYYSWGGSYSKGDAGNWILNIYDDIEVDFSEMECSLRDFLKEYMETGNEFKDSMKSLIQSDMEDRHGAGCGYVDSVTVVVTCTTSNAAAFGAIDEDGNVELPFSTWNLNSYDFSDWFVLLFVLFTGCACCFGCGWAMHRRRVFKAMDDASISDFGGNGNVAMDTPMVTMDGNASPHIHVDAHHVADNSNYAMHTNEPEIEIGVSVNSNNHGIMAEDSE